MLFGFVLIRIHPKLCKWVQFPLSRVGFSGDGGMENDSHLNVIKFLLGKRTGKGKADISVRMEQRGMDSVSWEDLLWNACHLRAYVHFS